MESYVNKNEGAIKNGQSRDTGTINIGNTKHRTKTNTTQQTKTMNKTNPPTLISHTIMANPPTLISHTIMNTLSCFITYIFVLSSNKGIFV